MTKILRIGLVAVLMFCLAQTASAQKFGYTSSQAILMEMPDVKQAESRLETLQKQLKARYEKMLQSYQTKRQDLEKRYAAGQVSQVELEKELKVLGEEEKKIMTYEQDMRKQMAEKRAELMEPILDKVQKAIDEVADETGYQYIFDQGTGVLLYAKDEDDITAKVKAKLGM